MEKVYFDNEKYGKWVVKNLEDYYNFKAVNFETNEESNHILSWSRNYDMINIDSNVDRIYDVEIDDGAGEITRIFEGIITVLPNVTR
jgi:hypothetical protein